MYFLCIYLNSQKTLLSWKMSAHVLTLPQIRENAPTVLVTDSMTCFLRSVLSCINSWIEQYPHLSNIHEEMFKTSVHDHWSPQTAKHILSDWRTQFNF